MGHISATVSLIEFADSHLPIFERWLAKEHATPWFEHPLSWLEEVRDRYQQYQWIHHYIITSDNTPFGFCQYYPYWESIESWHGTLPIEGTYSIDYLVGEPDYLSKGYAGTAIDILCISPMLKEGQVFYADYAKPEGFCDEAWKAIYQYAFALSHGAKDEVFYYGDWIRIPGVAICSCNDGLRPVIFKLEATDEESQIDYKPVR